MCDQMFFEVHGKNLHHLSLGKWKVNPQRDANRHPLQWRKVRLTVRSDSENTEQLYSHSLLMETQNCMVTLENSLAGSYNVKTFPYHYDPEIPILGIYQRESTTYSHAVFCMQLHSE